MNKANPIRTPFSHAEDPADAEFHPGLTRSGECVQAILIGARRHDRRIVFGRRIEIVIVVIEPSLFQLFGLTIFEHTQRHAGLEAFRFYCRDHRRNLWQVSVF